MLTPPPTPFYHYSVHTWDHLAGLPICTRCHATGDSGGLVHVCHSTQVPGILLRVRGGGVPVSVEGWGNDNYIFIVIILFCPLLGLLD